MMMMMMMIPQVSLLLLLSSLQVSKALFKPYQISYDDLLAGHVSSFGLVQALTADGLVAISDMAVDEGLLRSQHPCLLEQARQVLKAPDGTVRYTLATQTTPRSSSPADQGVAAIGGLNVLSLKTEDSTTGSGPTACQEFNDFSLALRINVQAAVQAFASVLDLALGLPQQEQGELGGEGSTSFFTDMVQQGTHLEHFHSYVKTVTHTTGTSQEQQDDNTKNEVAPTLDWHVDQGVFLAFMPGRYETSGEITQGFFIRDHQGKAEQVDFAGASLVFMLGDGVRRYVSNDKYKKLQPVQHALRVPMTASAQGQARIWYGLMVLPPATALIMTTHHLQGDQKTTFGDIRNGLVQMHPDAFALGCSQGVATAVSGTSPSVSRRVLRDDGHTNHSATESDPSVSSNLEEQNCPADDQVYCWHRCMNLTEYALTHETCEAQGQLVSCLNPRGELSDGDKHGDFFLACAAADTPPVSEFPTLPDHPRDDELCDDFDAFVADETYDYSMTLEGGSGAVLQWNVVTATTGGMEQKYIQGRLAFNGIFGYLSIGKSGAGGRNKMYNASVIFALRGSNYTPELGFELDTEPYIGVYMTSPNTTSYRFWTEMSPTVGSTYNTTNDACYTDLKFTTSSIAGQPLTIGGTDEMIWAANNVDTFAQYHGKNRGVFNITWEKPSPDLSFNSTSSGGALAAPVVTSGGGAPVASPASTSGGGPSLVSASDDGAAAVSAASHVVVWSALTLAVAVATIFV